MSTGPQVLTGRNNNMMGQQQQQLGGQQPQAGQNVNPLGQLAAFSARVAGSVNNPSSGVNLYSTTTSRNNYSHLLCLEDNAAEEQMKAQALIDAGNLATNIFNICVRRLVQNPYYKVLAYAKERFKCPKKNGPADPQLAEFIVEMDSNNVLYQFILANASIMFSSEFASAITRGDERLRTDRTVSDDMYYRCALDAIFMQYFDYLANHQEGSQIFYRATPDVKALLTGLEDKLYDDVLSKFTYAGVQCPWRKGRIAEITVRSSQANPLLEMHAPMDMGFAGTHYDPNQALGNAPQNNNAGNNEMDNFVKELVRRNAAERAGHSYDQQYPTHEPIIQTTYNNYDKPVVKLEDIKRSNMHNYNLNDYASQISGTEWWVIRPEHAALIVGVMDMDDDAPYRVRETRVLGHTVVYRFNWQAQTFNYRLIKNNLEADDIMSVLISNPDKLLPFMYEENGVQKTTFDPIVMETSKFINDGNVMPIGEMKDLEKEPDILIGSKPMKANEGNEVTIDRLNVYTKTFDPKGKLDAFVLPMVVTREWKMESHVNMDRFYSQFKVMVQGSNSDLDDTLQVIRHIRGAMIESDSEEFRDFVNPYITNLVNRWLIECRGYAETKQESLDSTTNVSYMRSTDIFEDLDDWVDWLKEHDVATLRAFADYRFNTFMRTGIEIICSREDTLKEHEEKHSKIEDAIYRKALVTESEKTIIIRRNTVFINLTKQPAPHTTEAIVIKESQNPEVFAIIREATKITGKHFESKPQVLLKFNKDSGNKVYVVTPSDIDPDSVITIRTISQGQTYCHPYPVMD